ncbi:unnamed protein product [Lymnaea stagnalis]|uniref:Sulfotransferase domain-containing protein n=1 Tax=Lymnaea stagnalis TaxID=6523 RepID=A0AAV2HT36_LYMST
MRIHVSCYSIFLREWLSVFNHQHFLILRTEDYHSNMKETLTKAFQFLQVPPLPEHDLDLLVKQKVIHETRLKKKAGPMYPETRALLDEFFYRFNQDLSQLLNDTRFMWPESS